MEDHFGGNSKIVDLHTYAYPGGSISLRKGDESQ
jgi:hypothetical protein